MIRFQTLARHIWVAAIMAASAMPVSALPTLSTDVLSIYQIGRGSGVNLGHVVHASTVYNRIVAGGTFVAACPNPLMLPARGERIFSADNFGGGLVVHVTVPQTLPATVSMPGFYSLTRGTTLDCTYTWTSKAIEGGYSIGANGVTFQTGNGERSEGFFKSFTMTVPGDTNSDDWQGCIP